MSLPAGFVSQLEGALRRPSCLSDCFRGAYSFSYANTANFLEIPARHGLEMDVHGVYQRDVKVRCLFGTSPVETLHLGTISEKEEPEIRGRRGKIDSKNYCSVTAV